MADVAVENKDAPVVEKEVEEVDAAKKVESAEKTTTENGAAEEETKENGDAAKETEDAPDAAVTADDAKDEESAPSTDEEQNGDKKDEAEAEAEETNGDSTDAPAEAVKRKVAAEADAKSDETAATPEKKAKLEETKEDVTNGSDATEVAA